MENYDTKCSTITEGKEMTNGDFKNVSATEDNQTEITNGHFEEKITVEAALEQLKIEKENRHVLEKQISFLSDRLKASWITIWVTEGGLKMSNISWRHLWMAPF